MILLITSASNNALTLKKFMILWQSNARNVGKINTTLKKNILAWKQSRVK